MSLLMPSASFPLITGIALSTYYSYSRTHKLLIQENNLKSKIAFLVEKIGLIKINGFYKYFLTKNFYWVILDLPMKGEFVMKNLFCGAQRQVHEASLSVQLLLVAPTFDPV